MCIRDDKNKLTLTRFNKLSKRKFQTLLRNGNRSLITKKFEQEFLMICFAKLTKVKKTVYGARMRRLRLVRLRVLDQAAWRHAVNGKESVPAALLSIQGCLPRSTRRNLFALSTVLRYPTEILTKAKLHYIWWPNLYICQKDFLQCRSASNTRQF